LTGVKIAIKIEGEKAQMKIDSKNCVVAELMAAISYLELAKLDLLNQIRQGLK